MPLDAHARALRESLTQVKLAPGSADGLIPAEFQPTTSLQVSFGKKIVNLGNLFRAGECKVAPRISFAAEIRHATYPLSHTLIMTDPDAPTPDDPKFAFWRHWVVSGLQSTTGADHDAAKTMPALTEYLGPGPKDDSKPHRYLFLLYREPEGLVLAKDDVGGEEFVQRRSFKPAEFADRHGLQLVACNWMTCAGDGWVEHQEG